MAQLNYNGIDFGHLYTTSLDQAPEMDQSQSDEMYTVVDLRTTAIITGFIPAPLTVPPAKQGETTAAAVADRIKEALTLPRRPLTYTVSGVKLIDLPTGQDDRTGPIPYGVTVAAVQEGAFVINWGVKLRLNACKDRPPGFLPLVLSNRWTETATINDRWLTTVSRRGKVVFGARANVNPDDYRNVVTPDIRTGFERKTAEYALAENGLEVMYQFVDAQKPVMTPWPAVKASGRQSETAAYPGVVRFGQLDIRLEGAPGTPKTELLDAALRIALSRALAGGLVKQGNGGYLVGGAVAEDLFENAVELSMRWQVQPGKGRDQPVQPGFFAGVFGGLLGGALQLAAGPQQDPNGAPAAQPPAPDPQQPGGFWDGVGRGLLGVPGRILAAGAQGVAQALVLDQANALANPGGGPGVPGGQLNNNQQEQAGVTTGTAAWLGLPLPGSGDPSVRGLAPPYRGSAEGLRLVAALLKDPCLTQAVNPNNDNPPGDDVPKVRELTSPRVAVFPTLPPFNPSPATLYDDPSEGPYDHYEITLHYDWGEGTDLLESTGQDKGPGTLSPDGTTIIYPNATPKPHPQVTLHNPTLALVVEVTAKRTGGPAVLPNPRKTDGNAVFVGGSVSPGMIQVAADGLTPVHTVTASFRYKFKRPDLVDLVAPVPPFLAKSAAAEASLTAALVSGQMLFIAPPAQSPSDAINIFTGANVTDVSTLGTISPAGGGGAPSPAPRLAAAAGAGPNQPSAGATGPQPGRPFP